jgi:hypothetical protein
VFVDDIRSIEDEVESECERLSPLPTLAATNEVVSAEELNRCFRFSSGMGQSPNFGTQCLGPEDTELAESTSSMNKGGVCRETSAHHGGGLMGRNLVRDWEGELFVDARVGTEASLREDLCAEPIFHWQDELGREASMR